MANIEPQRIPFSVKEVLYLHFLFKELGSQKPTEGYCAGFSYKVIEAWLLKERECYNSRIQNILNEKNILARIKSIQNKVKLEVPLSEEEAWLEEVKPLCESIDLAQQPMVFPELYGNKYTTQNNIAEISRLASSVKTQEQGGLITVYAEPHILTEHNYLDQLDAIKEVLTEDNGLILKANEHVVALTYNPATKYWGLTDTNGWLLFETADSDEIFLEILRSLKYPLLSTLFREQLECLKLPRVHESYLPFIRRLRKLFGIDALVVDIALVTTRAKQDLSLSDKLKALHDRWSSAEALQSEIQNSNHSEMSTYQKLAVMAAATGKHDLIHMIATANKDVLSFKDKQGHTLAHYAAHLGHPNIIAELAKHGTDFTVAENNGFSPAYYAAQFGHPEVIAELAKHGDSYNIPNCFGQTPIFIATQLEHIKVIAELAKLGVNFNQKDALGQTPAHIAAQVGNPEVIAELDKHGADFNLGDAFGRTPAHFAAQFNHPKIFVLLDKLGADLNSQDINEETPVDVAAKLGHTEVIAELANLGADLNIQDTLKHTPAHVAASTGRTEVIAELAKHGTDFNLADLYGKTPVFYAAENGHIEVISELAEHGTHFNLEDNDGYTPAYYAAINGHAEVVSEILKNDIMLHSDIEYKNMLITHAAAHGHHNVYEALSGQEIGTSRKYLFKMIETAYSLSEYSQYFNIKTAATGLIALASAGYIVGQYATPEVFTEYLIPESFTI